MNFVNQEKVRVLSTNAYLFVFSRSLFAPISCGLMNCWKASKKRPPTPASNIKHKARFQIVWPLNIHENKVNVGRGAHSRMGGGGGGGGSFMKIFRSTEMFRFDFGFNFISTSKPKLMFSLFFCFLSKTFQFKHLIICQLWTTNIVCYKICTTTKIISYMPPDEQTLPWGKLVVWGSFKLCAHDSTGHKNQNW